MCTFNLSDEANGIHRFWDIVEKVPGRAFIILPNAHWTFSMIWTSESQDNQKKWNSWTEQCMWRKPQSTRHATERGVAVTSATHHVTPCNKKNGNVLKCMSKNSHCSMLIFSEKTGGEFTIRWIYSSANCPFGDLTVRWIVRLAKKKRRITCRRRERKGSNVRQIKTHKHIKYKTHKQKKLRGVLVQPILLQK